MKNEDNRKYAIYSRKSRFTGKGESIENQIELCKHYIKAVAPKASIDDMLIFEDEGFSGGNTNRPKFQEMLSMIKNDKIKAVVCYRLDRISRNVADFSIMYETFQDMNVDFWSVSEKYDTSTITGRAMISMCTVFAQMERETIAERIRDNMYELAKSGRWLGGVTPTGYKSTQIVGSVSVDGKERKAYKLDIIKEEAELIQLIFNKFIETTSLTKTETYLFQNNITTKNGNYFSRFAIKGILKNPVYLIADQKAWDYFKGLGADMYCEQSKFDGTHGIMAYNKTMQKSGKANQVKEIDKWIITVGKHKGIINSKDWITVQNQLEKNSCKSYRKPKSNIALLSGLLYCGNCDSFMRPKLSGRYNSNGERIYDYLCETKERSKSTKCKMKRPNGNLLDKKVCEEIKKLSENSSVFIKELENTRRQILSSQDNNTGKLESLQKELTDIESKIKNLVTNLSRSDDKSIYDYISLQINELHEKKLIVQKHIKDLENIMNAKNISDEEFDILKQLLQSFGSSFETMSVEQKRSAIRTFVKRIVWDGENIHIYMFGNNDADIDFSKIACENLEPYCEDRK